MLALLLYLWLGREAAVVEIMAEVLIGLAITGGGGGGRRIRRIWLVLLERLRQRPVTVTA